MSIQLSYITFLAFLFSKPVFCIDLGQGFTSSSQELKQACFVNDVSYAGYSEADLGFSLDQKSEYTSTSASGKMKVGLGGSFLGVDAKYSAKMETAHYKYQFRFSQSYSVKFKPEVLREYKMTELGRKTLAAVPMRYQDRYWLWHEFEKICGDSLITEVQRGGRIVFDIDILSEKLISDVQTRKTWTLKVLFAKRKKTELRDYSKEYRNDRIFISVKQEGGDPEIYNELFPNEISCTYEASEPCTEAVAKILDYISTTDEGGFAYQIKTQATVLDFYSRPYKNLGLPSDVLL